MKPQELRVGNIVEVNHYEYGDMYASVTSINDVGDLCLHLLDERFTNEQYECTMNEVCPIPITEEILLKNGFKQKGFGETPFYALFGHSCGLWICMQEFEDGWEIQSLRSDRFDRSNYVGLINYVHEMQNYLNLAKHELEVKL